MALLLLWPRGTAADSFLRLEAGATARKAGDRADKPGFTLGGALGLTRFRPLANLAFVPQLELLFARRNASTASDRTPDASFTIDTIDVPLVLRSELTIGSRTFYALAGAYSSVLLRAQRTNADGVIERADTASPVEIGLALAGGFELASFAWGELLMEARYQRGYRAALPGSGENQEVLSVLLGYGLSSETSETLSRAREQRLTLKGGLVATRFQSPDIAARPYSPGVSFGGAFSPLRLGSSMALMPQLELAFVHRSAHLVDGSLALDSIDVSMLLRGELPVAGSTVYGMGGVYGSALLRAERTRDGVTTNYT